MTEKMTKAMPRQKPRLLVKKLGFCYMSLFVIILFFKNAEAAAAWVSEGLRLCAGRLIPSLFPFMVISSLIVSSGVGTFFGKLLSKPFGALFGISGDGACAVVLGWACGFPVGAKCASELYDSMRISETEYKKLLCISSTPSPAFLIGTVGGTMLGSKPMGIWLYAISIIASLSVGFFLKITLPDTNSPRSHTHSQHEATSFSVAFTRAVADSAVGMLSVCAFVVFFSAFLGALEQALSFLSLSDTTTALMFSFFELTSGLARLSYLNSPITLPLCALAVGWSGLSVHFQSISLFSHSYTPIKPYLLSHATRSAICFALAIALSGTFA